MLSPTEVARTVDTIADAQQADGMVPWGVGGHGDPWNHVEAAMALTLGGRWSAAERAYLWLVANQNSDGSWFNYYRGGTVEDRRLDTNVAAYVAVGIWQHHLATDEVGFLEGMFPMVESAMAFVIRLQQPTGEVRWCIEPDGSVGRYALLTASSSIYFSLRCAIASVHVLGERRPEWELAAARLAHSLRHQPERFAPKHRYAMDWYYPVLSGIIDGDQARDRLHQRWPTFVMDGLGVRCVADQPWVTAAETAECSMAFTAAGLQDEAHLLLDWAHHLRHDDGSYWTGCVHPQGVHFPGGERSTYGAAAVVLAHHLLWGSTHAELLFTGKELDPPPVATLAGSL